MTLKDKPWNNETPPESATPHLSINRRYNTARDVENRTKKFPHAYYYYIINSKIDIQIGPRTPSCGTDTLLLTLFL